MKLGALKIDERDYAMQGNAILGIRDSGKTYTATYFAERLIDSGIPFIAFDPIGVWRYLKVGRKRGLGKPVVVAGDNGDLPLTPEIAPGIVRAAMAENISLVLDLYSMHLSKQQWRKIVEESVRLLLYENKAHGLRHIFIEEAAEFVPQRVRPDEGRVYAEIEKLARMGRNAYLGYTLINQRPEEVNKAILELCDSLFLHRQKGRHSLTSLSKWMDIADAGNAREVTKSLPTLPQGQCWVWPAGAADPVLVAIPQKDTEHPDPKKSGVDIAGMATRGSSVTDVSGFVDKLQKAIAKQQAQPKANVKIVRPDDPFTPHPAVHAGAEEMARATDQIDSLTEQVRQLTGRLQEAERETGRANEKLAQVREMLGPDFERMQRIFEIAAPNGHGAVDPGKWAVWLEKLTGKKRDMLQALIEHKRLSKVRLGLLVGMSPNGGSFNTYLSSLASLRLVKREGDEIVLQEI